MITLAPTLQTFFTDRLIRQRQASSHTIAAYRDTFRLLLAFAEHRTGSPPSRLRIDDLDASLIGAFLDHLEHGRGNSVRTRNARLAAIHSLFRYAALRHPEHSQAIQRVVAIPPKRFDRIIVTYLTNSEVDALLAAPNRTSWIGRRDHTILVTMIQTGLRASELVGLDRGDIALGVAAHISCLGKGRKQRITPLTKSTVAVLTAWTAERGGTPDDPLFPGRTGSRLSRDSLERRITKHVATAASSCPSIATKTVSPHTLRHTCHAAVARRCRHLGHRAVART
jgi:integrase/recombinase XerD